MPEITFSQRIGLEPTRKTLQVDSMNAELRNALWNIMYAFYFKSAEMHRLENDVENMVKYLRIHFFNMPIDEFVATRHEAEKNQRIYTACKM
jgi:hypothetical protein